MTPGRVLVVNIRSLLMEGVESLLATHGKFVVVNTFANNRSDLIREIEELKPGVIVIDAVTSFIKPADLIVSLQDVHNIRLVVLNNQTNKMDIYDKSETIISNLDHFIEALNYGAASSS